MGMIKRVVHNLDYEEIDKRENKRLHKKGKIQEESKSDSSDEDTGMVQKKTVTEKVNYF